MAFTGAIASTSKTLLPCCRNPSRAIIGRALATTATRSTTSSSQYTPPLKPGQLPVYDEALAYLQKDKKEKLKLLEATRARKNETGTEEQKVDLENEILGLEIASEINMPETRWKFRSGQADMSKPVYRYLSEQAWRRDGRLGILMQRVTQMHVVPDLLAIIDPDADLQVLIEDILDQTISPPEVRVQVYHPEERLYTLLLVDPDSPYPEADSFKTQCHWALANVPLSATSSTISAASGGAELLSYIPPHPQKGTKYHRYTYILFEQSSSIPEGNLSTADNFNVRSFVAEHSLKPVGIHFFRQEWDRDVSKMYGQVFQTTEPIFGRPKKVDYLARDDEVEEVVGDRHAVL